RSLHHILLSEGFLSEIALYQALAAHDNVPFVDLSKTLIPPEILGLLAEPVVQTHHLIPFERNEQVIKVAMVDSDDLQTIDVIRKQLPLSIEIYQTTPSSIDHALQQYHHGVDQELESIARHIQETVAESETVNSDDPKDLERLAQNLPIIKVVETLLDYAVFEGASDIHIEPAENNLLVRYRIDGILKDVMTLPKTVLSGLVARIKILSNLKLDEHRLPQDGRFKIVHQRYKVAVRVSVIPVFDGEKVVMRILDEAAEALDVKKLGFHATALQVLMRNMSKPHGLILVTGPTGSGKTTTLYSILGQLNTTAVNISTIEDPIEYRIPRINQSQVNPKIGFTFASGLRALLRQDPNIIMVGEIRDNETAEMAIHAAMTGHLVLSTLHTNDAPSTIARLSEMNVPPYLLASTTNLVIGQRLVRRLCPDCHEEIMLGEKELEQFQLLDDVLTAQQFTQTPTRPSKKAWTFFKSKGCNLCGQEGYKGRLGIFELLEVTPPIAQLIATQAPITQLQDAAKKQGMITMLQDGLLKALAGITSIEEVLRVTRE
ncbi:MAG: GspE/PulE family protein, partial [Patescibacteria group bacterium]